MDREYVGIDFHRRRSVIVRKNAAGEKLNVVRVVNDPWVIAAAVAEAGPEPEVVIEATHGWYWIVDWLQAQGANVHLANPTGLTWGKRRVKTDERDANDLVDMLRLGLLPEAWIAPPATRELRELVRYRAKLVALRSGLKAQVHAVMAKEGVLPDATDMFGRRAPNRRTDQPASPLRRRARSARRRSRAIAGSGAPAGEQVHWEGSCVWRGVLPMNLPRTQNGTSGLQGVQCARLRAGSESAPAVRPRAGDGPRSACPSRGPNRR
jgi:hypothetical protein